MRVIGYCVSCRKIKRINARPMQGISRNPMGECDACIEHRKKPR